MKQGINLQTETAKENIERVTETAKETLGVEKEGKQEEKPYFAPEKWNYQWKGREGLEGRREGMEGRREGLEIRKEGLGISEQKKEGQVYSTESRELGQQTRSGDIKPVGLLTEPKEPLVSK